jgi:NADH dehydrogenase
MLISALGVRQDGVSRYQTSKYEAECRIRESSLAWTIFRPSFVIGPGAGFVSEISPIVRFPLIPVFGRGDSRFEPIDLRMLADAVVTSIDNTAARNALFELRGENSYSWVEILREIARALGKKKARFFHVPVWFVKLMVFLFGWLPLSPISRDQLAMLLEGNTGNGRNAVEELGLDWIEFPDAIAHALGKG